MKSLVQRGLASRALGGVALIALVCAAAPMAWADDDDMPPPGSLLLSRTVFPRNFSAVTSGVTQLPPNCVPTNCVTAVDGSAYPFVFNNASADGSFGLTSPIFIDAITADGHRIGTLEIPNSDQRDEHSRSDQMVTSFASKSELALNLSLDGKYVTFMGYLAPAGALDISNSNTPAVVDPTNPVPSVAYRLIARMDARGRLTFTKTNAYSGNNGRAAILANANGLNEYLMSGNAGNGANPQPAGIVLGAGAQIATPSSKPLSAQSDPGLPTPVGSFNITQLGDKADKLGKDTNFRGLTIYNNVVYLTKGSGGNGVKTVYFIDTSGFDVNGKPKACPNGVGLPASGATLPAGPMTYQSAALGTLGVYPYNMCVLKGFPTTLAKTATAFPFGVWFANATTMYVADEGDGKNAFATNQYTAAAASTTAGLQKWVFDGSQGQWKLAYVLQAGLDLGAPYQIPGYPSGVNPATNLPWAPATDGLRNLTGRVNRDGTATIYAITSTVSGGGDQGADPNKLVAIVDNIAATTPPTSETFRTLRTAGNGEALRGVSFAPSPTRTADRD